MKKHNGMRPQDIPILLKIIAKGDEAWQLRDIAVELEISQSEVSESLNRSKIAGLINSDKREVHRLALMDFLQFGLKYVFPTLPTGIAKGIPTAHSAKPLNEEIVSQIPYVWPYMGGDTEGLAVEPLYPKLPTAALKDKILYNMLALLESLRVGKQREKNLAIEKLKEIILVNA